MILTTPPEKQAIPTAWERRSAPEDQDDPLHEDGDSPVFGLTHRYPDRVLSSLPICAPCIAATVPGGGWQARKTAPGRAEIDACIEYIRQHPMVRDVLLSGGDALLMSDDRLEYILKELRGIEHVEIIRIGTRTPVVMPQRITPELCRLLKNYQPVWLNMQFNHPNEIHPKALPLAPCWPMPVSRLATSRCFAGHQ